MRHILALGGALALSACAIPPNIASPALTNDNQPTKQFAYCTSAGCSAQVWARFSDAEWAEIGAFFDGVRDAAGERAAIEKAMSRYEQVLGPRYGTAGDRGQNGFYAPVPGQLDCFAEAANSGMALSMMAKAGYLKFHKPLTDQPTMRGVPYGTIGLVHASATLQEIADGHLWVVDTWYADNGGPSYVVDRDEWRGGWSPDDATS